MKRKKIIKKLIKKSRDKTVLHIVKRRGHTELYDERKVYGSCYFACRNAHMDQKGSEDIANKVCTKVTKAISKKKFVSSDDIFKLLTEELRKYDDDAAFLYETHRDIS